MNCPVCGERLLGQLHPTRCYPCERPLLYVGRRRAYIARGGSRPAWVVVWVTLQHEARRHGFRGEVYHAGVRAWVMVRREAPR